MAKIDIEDALSADKEEHKAVKDPCDEDMCIEAVLARILVGIDVGKGQHIELLPTITASGIDREEDRPCDDAADKCNDCNHSKISQEEV